MFITIILFKKLFVCENPPENRVDNLYSSLAVFSIRYKIILVFKKKKKLNEDPNLFVCS